MAEGIFLFLSELLVDAEQQGHKLTSSTLGHQKKIDVGWVYRCNQADSRLE